MITLFYSRLIFLSSFLLCNQEMYQGITAKDKNADAGQELALCWRHVPRDISSYIASKYATTWRKREKERVCV